MLIREFRYLTKNDYFDPDIINWSRGAEYGYVLNELKRDSNIKSVHNTSCGGWQQVHQQFISKLNTLIDKEIINSDAVEQNVPNFHIYNILDKPIKKYDCVLSVSTIEDFQRYDLFKQALDNLLDMTTKRLIVTADDNGIEVRFIQDYFNLPKNPLPDKDALRGGNSIYPNPFLNYLKIILLDVEK